MHNQRRIHITCYRSDVLTSVYVVVLQLIAFEESLCLQARHVHSYLKASIIQMQHQSPSYEHKQM